MFKQIFRLKKTYKILIIIGLIAVIAGTVFYVLENKNNSKQIDDNKMTYVNLLQEIQFQMPKDWIVEDIITPKSIILYPNKETIKTAQKSEEDFYNAGNIQIKMLREIPGKDQVFDYFIEKEFEPILTKNKMEWTKEKFVSDNGYNSSKFKITKPFEFLYIIIDSPVAYWVSVKEENQEVKNIVDSFKPAEDQNKTEAKKSSFALEEFIKRMKEGDVDELYKIATPEFGQKYSKETLQKATEGVKNSLERPFVLVSSRFNNDTAYARGVLENNEKNNPQYALVTAELKKVGNDYKINAIQIDKDREGTPSQQSKPQTPSSAQDLLKKMK